MDAAPEQAAVSEEAMLEFESRLRADPYDVRTWWSYIQERFTLYERALATVPGSYKLWHAYLLARVESVRGRSIADPRLEVVNNTFERALVFMHKMPVIWVEYVTFLGEQRRITRTRRVFDRALRALPVTQHDRIWRLYVDFVRASRVPETIIRVYRRYLMFNPAAREDYAEFLLAEGMWDEAVVQMAAMLDTKDWTSTRGTSRHDLWAKLCDTVASHPGDIHSVHVESLIRSGITRYPEDAGKLWSALAEYYVRAGAFEAARNIYEEAMNEVSTVRDFATVFDAYVQFEEALLTAKLEIVRDVSSSESGAAAQAVAAPADAPLTDDSQLAPLDALQGDAADADDVDLRVARIELLLDRRPLLLSAVLLRQNPHNVYEWVKRTELLAKSGASPARIIATFSEAVTTVDPAKAVGKLSTLWIAFAGFYEKHEDAENARGVYRKATVTGRFKTSEDLALVWCSWVEFELRLQNERSALQMLDQLFNADYSRERGAPDHDTAVRRGVARSVRLWGLYLDLQEAFGTLESTRAAYDLCMTMKVATPMIVLNYAAFLEERKFFEDSFRAFERGISLFPWPHVKEIWVAYLDKFVKRYGASKLERARELFEQAVAGCPADDAALFYSMYADMEEKHGLVRHAMSVYDRMTRVVPENERYAAYITYITKAEEYFGAPRTREIYERALEALPEIQLKDMCMRFAVMEIKLGEVERARAIYTYAAQYCDPQVHTAFWQTWQAFEVAHGNEDTFRDMLRVKRSVAAQYAGSGTSRLLAAVGGSASAAASAAPKLVPASSAPALADTPAIEVGAAAGAASKGPIAQGALQRFQAAGAAPSGGT